MNDHLEMLNHAGVFFDADDLDNCDGKHMLNLNDTFGWACADMEEVKPEQLAEVARLFRWYGLCGIYYWVTLQRPGMTIEFKDVQRSVEFVRREEEQVKREPSSSKRAYMDLP